MGRHRSRTAVGGSGRRHRHTGSRRVGGRALILVAVAALVATGCGSSGRELRAPPNFAASQARFVPVNQSQGPGGMLIEGTDFAPGGELPPGLLETGEPPTLVWWNIPPLTTELVVLVSAFDPQEPPVLWAVAGLGPSSAGLFGGPLPPGVRSLPRAGGELDWPGYPPAGTRVVFSLCALTAPLSPDAAASDAWNLCYSDSLGLATVSGLVPAAQT
ncbi:MAG: hypothetical protein OXG55_04030 [bacterium]|nr:hypothetical protein [bacterium]MCY4102423.1 hypothetical protein [bacterium]